MTMLAFEPSRCLQEPHTDSCMRNVAVKIPSQLMWLESGRNPVKSSVEEQAAVLAVRADPLLSTFSPDHRRKSPSSQSYYHTPICPLHPYHQPLIYIHTAGTADLAITLTRRTSDIWSFMGYYTNNESVTSIATAQTKIAVSVFLGIAGGLSRTESSFANLDWLLAAGPP